MTTVLEALNAALHSAMETDPRVFFLGEDVLDPYGGAFKVSRGLSTRFPQRVLTTPISEPAMMGIANGMALRGLRPVVEIMFGDFLTLVTDQLCNHAAKFHWMYNDQVRVQLVVRTPMGGRRGYGPTHSQSLEKHFLGMPGLRVVAPNAIVPPDQLLLNAILHDDDPVLFVEHKLLYARKVPDPALVDFTVRTVGDVYPTAVLSFPGAPRPAVTFACYGYMAELVREAMLHLLMEREIFTEAVVYTQLSPADHAPLLDSLRRSGRLITVEEGGGEGGWGSEVIAAAMELADPGVLHAARRVAARELPIPCSRVLEEAILPTVDDITRAVYALTPQEAFTCP
jgi:pyruvate/2-oxoglutarate/acetoin dehydrogenase E1 component